MATWMGRLTESAERLSTAGTRNTENGDPVTRAPSIVAHAGRQACADVLEVESGMATRKCSSRGEECVTRSRQVPSSSPEGSMLHRSCTVWRRVDCVEGRWVQYEYVLHFDDDRVLAMQIRRGAVCDCTLYDLAGARRRSRPCATATPPPRVDRQP
jgi:hypothetical protein